MATIEKTNADDMVSVFIPKENEKQGNLFVAVNFVPMEFERGKMIEVPRAYAEAIKNAEKAELK